MAGITGDTHGDIDFHKLSNKNVRTVCSGELPRYMIICGDFGVPWSNNLEDKQDNYLRRYYMEKPYEVIVCPGNHDNYDRIEQMPREEYLGGMVRRYSDNIIFVEKNNVLTIEGKTFYFFGGANSIDKMYRTPHVSWWEQENATYADGQALVTKIREIPRVDYVISHTCPESIISEFTNDFIKIGDNCPTRVALDAIKDTLKFSHWYFGHFHRDKTVGKFTCCYNKIHTV